MIGSKESRLVKSESWNVDKNVNIGQVSNKNNPSMQIGEPVLLNPNSFINIEHILEEYHSNHGIGAKR